MDTIGQIAITMLTSTVISGICVFIVKESFKATTKLYIDNELEKARHSHELEIEALRHSFEIETEKLKNELATNAQTIRELTERRLALYPRTVELIYRARNLSRDITRANNVNTIQAQELQKLSHDIEDNLYACRLDFERDGVFVPLHGFKNTVKTFSQLVGDHVIHLSRGKSDEAHAVFAQLQPVYDIIEQQHGPIIASLSATNK